MKYFTLKQAEKAISKLEEILTLANDIRNRAQSKTKFIQETEERGTKDIAAMAIEKAQVEFLAQCFQDALEEIEKMGAVLKGIDPGLVDFPCRFSNETVYLCWRQGEKSINNYHSMDEGFAGRKPLPKSLV